MGRCISAVANVLHRICKVRYTFFPRQHSILELQEHVVCEWRPHSSWVTFGTIKSVGVAFAVATTFWSGLVGYDNRFSPFVYNCLRIVARHPSRQNDDLLHWQRRATAAGILRLMGNNTVVPHDFGNFSARVTAATQLFSPFEKDTTDNMELFHERNTRLKEENLL